MRFAMTLAASSCLLAVAVAAASPMSNMQQMSQQQQQQPNAIPVIASDSIPAGVTVITQPVLLQPALLMQPAVQNIAQMQPMFIMRQQKLSQMENNSTGK